MKCEGGAKQYCSAARWAGNSGVIHPYLISTLKCLLPLAGKLVLRTQACHQGIGPG
jgi:hypothetical protein